VNNYFHKQKRRKKRFIYTASQFPIMPPRHRQGRRTASEAEVTEFGL